MVNYLDDVVGELVDALKKRELWDNLLFVTSSDNGGPVHEGSSANNHPLKGGKVSDWLCVGKRPLARYIWLTGTQCFAILPMSTQQTKEQLISGQIMDSPREGIPISNTTLISGDYRILTGVVPLAGWTGPQFPNQTNPNGGIPTEQDCSNSGCLYNIMEDPEERTDLAPNKARCSEGYATKVGEVQSYLF